MDITKYFPKIEVTATDENHINDFITVKGKELKDESTPTTPFFSSG